MKRLVPRLLGILVALLFLYAGGLKALDPAAFARDIENYQILSAWPSAFLALYLPWLELLAAAALLLGRARQGALSMLLVLCVAFVTALASAWYRGLDINCGCFGENSSTVVTALIRAALLGGLIGWLLFNELRADKTACARSAQEPALR